MNEPYDVSERDEIALVVWVSRLTHTLRPQHETEILILRKHSSWGIISLQQE